MLPGYRAELERLTRGGETAPPVRLRVGDTVRIVVPGDRHHGTLGTLLKRGRTRFHLRVGDRVLTVPFSMVEPA
jgi:hypothetical protein